MTDYTLVLASLFPDALWGLTNNDLSTLTWDKSNVDPKPDAATLDAAWPEVRDARAWKRVRVERDRLLTGCDWTQVADAPLTVEEKEAWADYRQALRDVPQTQDDPENVVWPVAP